MNTPFGPGKAPNLDDFSDDPQELLAAAEVMDSYGDYLSWKASAIIYRKDGKIAKAEFCERMADKHHKSLPEWARW